MRTRAALALLVLLSAAGPAAAGDLWERRWVEVRTPHFVFASAVEEDETITLACELETFRRAVERVTNLAPMDVRTPTHVYVLPNRRTHFGLTRATWSYLLATLRANYAVTAPMRWADLATALRHDYVHFLMRSRARLGYPSWYEEGLADVLSTLRTYDGVLEYGRVEPMRRRSLAYPWLSFADILRVRDANHLEGRAATLFYAQSWLLVHYLSLGRPESDVGAGLQRYLALSDAGTPASEAFAQAFGLTVHQLGGRLRSHVRRLPFYTVLFSEPFTPEQAQVRPIPPDEMAARLGTLALVRGETERAARYADAALALNAANASALGVRAGVYEAEGRFAEAEPLRRRAAALEPDAALPALDLGAHLLERAKRASDGEAAALLDEAREHLARSHQLDPDDAEALARTGASYLTERGPRDPARAVAALEAAHERLPSHPALQLMLAQAYLAAGQPERASPLLDALLTWQPSRVVAAGAPRGDSWSAR
jgi:tetratricopeptide (TPR) repeat protein